MTSCPICKKHVRVRVSDGKMYVHKSKGQECSGSGCRPGRRRSVLREARAHTQVTPITITTGSRGQTESHRSYLQLPATVQVAIEREDGLEIIAISVDESVRVLRIKAEKGEVKS